MTPLCGARSLTALPFAALIVGGCGDQSSGEGEPWMTGPPTHALIEEWRSDPDLPLDIVASVVVHEDGHIFAADRTGAELHIFSPDGAYQGAWGGPGDGPGEFREIRRVFSMGADLLGVFDSAAHRITRISLPNLELLDILRLQPLDGAPPIDALSVAGSLIGAYMAPVRMEMAQEGWSRSTLRLARINGEGIPSSPIAELEGPPRLVRRSDDGLSMAVDPLGSFPMIAANQSGELVLMTSDRVAPRLVDPDGTEQRPFEADWALSPSGTLSWAAIAGEEPLAGEVFQDAFGASSPSGIVRGPVEFGELVLDDLDQLWIGLRAAGVLEGRWLALSPQGDVVAVTDLRDDHLVRAVRGDRVVTAPHAFAPVEPYLSVWRLVPQP